MCENRSGLETAQNWEGLGQEGFGDEPGHGLSTVVTETRQLSLKTCGFSNCPDPKPAWLKYSFSLFSC